MNKGILKKAIEEAEKSTHKYKIGAVIFDKKRIVSCGHNYPSKSVRSITYRFCKRKGSVHAEVDAIIRARQDLKGYSILVVRINKKGELLNAAPCSFCMAYIEYVGLKYVYYSTLEGIVKLKL